MKSLIPNFNNLKINAFLKIYSFLKIPLLAYVRPLVIENSKDKTVIKIQLNRRTKNHLNVMYFGALSIGAELVIALKAVDEIYQSGKKIDFIFKDFKGDFSKRADGDVLFICDEGQAVKDLITQALQTSERLEGKFKSYAVVPSKSPDEKVATFELTLSVKNRDFKK